MTNIRIVSKLAGVSVATVSRALQKPEVVSVATREKVEKAAKEAGYKPNMMARNFRSKKSYSILVLVPDVSNPFYSMVISGIQKHAKKRGYNIILGNTMDDPKLEHELANMLYSNQADGIIQLSSRFPLDELDKKSSTPPPIVNCCECVDDDSMPTVKLDNDGAIKALIHHLIQFGHKRIAVVTGPEKSPLTQARLAGYKDALKNADITLDNNLVIEGDYSMASGKKAASVLLAMSHQPTAICCFNDEMAIGAMQRIKQDGLIVPDDISVTGFDNLSFASYTDPPLTTISQPSEEFGSNCITLLFEIIENKEKRKRNLVLPYELIIRESTSPAKK